jgi:hypothetical protein
MALSAAVACGARRGARRAEVRRNGEEGKGKGVGLLFAPSQRIRRVAHTWGSNTRARRSEPGAAGLLGLARTKPSARCQACTIVGNGALAAALGQFQTGAVSAQKEQHPG